MEVRSDTEISKVLGELVQGDGRLRGSDLTLASRAGVVTLQGHVPHYWQKRVLLFLLHGIHGLLGIEDRLEVRPPVRKPDAELSAKAGVLLAENPWIPNGVTTNCLDGVVVLLGTVDNLRQRKYAEKVVEGLEGLVGIKNELAVRPKVVEDDLRIVQELRLLFENVGLPVEGMGVQSLDRIVVLTGSVNTLHQKITAGMIVEEHPAVAALHNKLLIVP